MEFEVDFSDQISEYLQTPPEQNGTEEQTGSQAVVTLDDGPGAYLGDAGMTVLIGIVVVLATLVLLTGIFKLFGIVMSGTSKKKPTPAKPVTPTPVKVAAPAAPVVQDGISDEVVAVIAAAVSAMSPEGKRYSVKRVSRTRGERPVWAAAGLADNTRPF